VKDTIEPDRLVYGVEDPRDVAVLDAVYASAIAAGTPRIVTNFPTAELVKVAANAFLATKISFINAMAEIAEATDADVTRLADAIGHDARIGRRFLNAGVGFGGGCLPKDIRAFTARAEELGRGESGRVPQGGRRHQPPPAAARRSTSPHQALDGVMYGRKIAVLGVTFKPHSDDVRDSPALDVAVQLKGLGADVVVTDPQGIDNARKRHPQLLYSEVTEEAVRHADLVVLVTEWPEYVALDPVHVKDIARGSTIIDGRNTLDADAWKAAGWRYVGSGPELRRPAGRAPRGVRPAGRSEAEGPAWPSDHSPDRAELVVGGRRHERVEPVGPPRRHRRVVLPARRRATCCWRAPCCTR
jgi:UDPglucose 6-dehydrogenase